MALNVTAPQLTIGDPAEVTIGWEVRNFGTGVGLSNSWTDRVIASADTIVGNADDVLLGSFDHIGALAVGQNYRRQESILLPPEFQRRSHLFVKTDALSVVFENGLEANNVAEATHLFDVVTAPYSDLVVSSVVIPVTAESGRTRSC